MSESMTAPIREPQRESPSLAEADEEEAPTYIQDTWSGLDHFVCLHEGWQCWSEADMTEHMERFHQGVMRAAPAGPGADEPPPSALAAPQEPAG